MHFADFLASWMASGGSMLICHPLDTLRTRLQTRGHRPLDILRKEPVRNLYAGVFTPLLVGGPISGVVFMCNEAIKERLIQHPAFQHTVRGSAAGQPYTEISMAGVTCAGAGAGCAGALLSCPSTTIRIQQQLRAGQSLGTPNRPHQGAVAVVRDLYHAEGIRGFYRGVLIEATAGVIGRAAYFSFYEGYKRGTSTAYRSYEANVLGKSELTPMLQLEKSLSIMVLSAALTSISSWLVIYPIDTVKSKIQGEAVPCSRAQPVQCPEELEERRLKRSFFKAARQLYKTNGVGGFFAGYKLTAARGAVMAGIMLPTFDTLKPIMRSLIEPHASPKQ